MMDLRAVHRYTRALFELAEKQKTLDRIESQFHEIKLLVERHHEIPHLVLNSTISFAEKEDFISKIVPSETSPLLLNFIKVLIKKKRFNELAAMQKEFHKLYEKKKGVREVEAVTAIALSQANEQKLITVLKKKLGSEIRLMTKVDPEMIGGLILRFDGTEVNSSYHAQLEELRQLVLS